MPGSDACHPVRYVIWLVVRLREEGRRIPMETNLRLERRERRSHEDSISRSRVARRDSKKRDFRSEDIAASFLISL